MRRSNGRRDSQLTFAWALDSGAGVGGVMQGAMRVGPARCMHLILGSMV